MPKAPKVSLTLPADFADWDQEDDTREIPGKYPRNTPQKPVLQPTSDVSKLRAAAKAHAPDLKRNLQQAVSGVPGARVAGVRAEKDPDRLQEKLEQKGAAPNQISDHLAGRVSVDSPEAKEQVIAKLRQQAPVLEDEDNFEAGGNNAFHSHNLQQQVSPKISAEVQVVPREQAATAERNHGVYEKQRSAEANGDVKTSGELSGQLEDANRKAKAQFDARQPESAQSIYGRARPDEAERKQFWNQRARELEVHKALTSAGIQTIGKPIMLGGKMFIAVDPKGAKQPTPLAKGDTVTLKDGSTGTVRFVHPAMGIARVAQNGKTSTMKLKDLQ